MPRNMKRRGLADGIISTIRFNASTMQLKVEPNHALNNFQIDKAHMENSNCQMRSKELEANSKQDVL